MPDTEIKRSAQGKRRRASKSRFLAILVGLALFTSLAATIAVMSDLSPQPATVATIITLLNVDIGLAAVLAAILARRILLAWMERQFGSAGSKLHFRMVLSFSLVAIIPAILVAIFSGVFLNFGIEAWFGDRVRTAVDESRDVAQLYLREHQQNIRADALAMANDINREAINLRQNPRMLADFITTQALFRELPEAVIVDSSGRLIAQSGLSFSLAFDFLTDNFLRQMLQSRPGEVLIISNPDDERVRAGVKLDAFVDAYLLVGRFVDTSVLDHISRTRGAAAQYAEIQASRERLQIRFLAVFGAMALLLFLTAAWVGWTLANRLAAPIGKLIDAAERVRLGDLTASVEDVRDEAGEVGTLIRAFNRMTAQIDNQQRGLIEANRQLDERRRFTETVLTGVSAGVIGLDADGRMYLVNRSASDLLGEDLASRIAEPLEDVVPEMAELLQQAKISPHRAFSGEIALTRSGRQRTLVASVAAERQADNSIVGFVITCDDVTELLSAQRKAAWADVARRIAHEIKNPLTPIQLAAERLKRKYRTQIVTDPETFTICTDTIVRQVEEIGRMVDEFSAFARMPRPDLKEIDLRELVGQSLFLERNRCPEIIYEESLPDEPVLIRCDRQQIGRALTNILKNASESVESLHEKNPDGPAGKIALKLTVDGGGPRVEIVDNGGGFPPELLDRITEPYVTTRERGTGLGLAIAKKIMEDHNGELMLGNNATEGATVVLMFYKPEMSETPHRDAASADAEALPHGV
jgi:two-component system nitrogen regulation sensor histidine kinase NtrY